MGISKLIILALLVWLGFKLYKVIQQRQLMRGNKSSAPPKQLSGDLVQCHTCHVHLPQETAISKNGRFYCPSSNKDCKP